MKKILFMIACCLMATVQKATAQNYGKAFLQHAGKITSAFNYNEIDKAIDAANEGDTIFLTKGMFNPGFTINNPVSIIGSGTESSDWANRTYFEWGAITIRTDNYLTTSINFEGIYFQSGISVESSIDQLTIKKCYLENGCDLSSNNNSIYKKVTYDKCHIGGVTMYGSIGDLTAKNCKINNIYGQGGQTNSSCKFINCNIRQVDTNTKAMFVNSIINQVGNGADQYLGNNAILVNTLYHNLNGYDPMDKTSQQDCWGTTETVISNNNSDLDCTMTADQLKAAGYLGVDGTVVGIEGGVNPYSLTIHAPSINSNSANVDLNNKKVTINVNVTAN